MSLLKFVKNLDYELTDKYSLGYIEAFYDRILTPRKSDVKNVLEIGIHQGLSLRLWRDYFTEAQIFGIDINGCPNCENMDRVNAICADAYTDYAVQSLTDISFDLIIDDGPHTPESWHFFCNKYIDLVKPGGIAVIEDIIHREHTSSLVHSVAKKGKPSVFTVPNAQYGPIDVLVVER